jgi:hypothetical protein
MKKGTTFKKKIGDSTIILTILDEFHFMGQRKYATIRNIFDKNGDIEVNDQKVEYGADCFDEGIKKGRYKEIKSHMAIG